MLTTPLAQQLCWKGSGQKMAFGQMLVCKAVIGAVYDMPLFGQMLVCKAVIGAVYDMPLTGIHFFFLKMGRKNQYSK